MSYTRDWSAATALAPWVPEVGAGYSFDGGLQFNGNPTLISLRGATYATGTTTVEFSIDGSGLPESNQKIGVSVWNVGESMLMAGVRSQIKNNDVNLWWDFTLVDRITGALNFVGSTLYDNGYSITDTGTLSVWHNSGTWYSSLNYESTDLGTNEFEDATYNPSATSCYIGHYGALMSGDQHVTITSGTYSPSVSAVPLTNYFWYEGNYNNGSSTGVKDLTAMMLTTSPIQQYLYVPTMKGIFDAQVNVTLKNDSDQWGSFTGHAVSTDSYNPGGVFYIRDEDVMSGNETLFAGFLDYKTISVDALNQTVSFTLHSVLSALADKPILPQGVVNAYNLQAGNYGMWRGQGIGTITAVVRDYGSQSGTVFVSPCSVELKANELLSTNELAGDNKGVFIVNEWLGQENGTGSFSLSKVPDFLKAGDYLTGNKAFPDDLTSSNVSAYSFFNTMIKDSLYFYQDDWNGATLGWNIATQAMVTALESVTLSPSMYVYGNETFIDVLDDFLIAIGGGGCSAYNGQTFNVFVPSPTYLLQRSSGTLNYNTDIYGAFTASKNSPIKSVVVDYAYNDERKKYLENIKIDTDFDYGDDKKISTWLINFNEDARNLAFFTSAYFSSGATLTTLTDTSHWSKQAPGNIVTLSNLPAEFEIQGSWNGSGTWVASPTDFIVLSRTFDPDSKLVTSLLQEITLEVSDFFRVGVSDIGGEDVVL